MASFRGVLAEGDRRTANFYHSVGLWLACATLEQPEGHRRITNFFHPVGLYNKIASCVPQKPGNHQEAFPIKSMQLLSAPVSN